MKTRTALVLSVAGVLLTGSAALAVNTRTFGNSSPSFTGTSNEVLLPQNATTPVSPAPASTDASARIPSPSGSLVPSPGDDNSTSPGPAGTGQPTNGHDVGNDKGGHGENETKHDSSGDDD